MGLALGFTQNLLSAEVTYELKSDDLYGPEWKDSCPAFDLGFGQLFFVNLVVEHGGQKSKELQCWLTGGVDNPEDWVGVGRRFKALIQDDVIKKIFHGKAESATALYADEFRHRKEITPKSLKAGRNQMPLDDFVADVIYEIKSNKFTIRTIHDRDGSLFMPIRIASIVMEHQGKRSQKMECWLSPEPEVETDWIGAGR